VDFPSADWDAFGSVLGHQKEVLMKTLCLLAITLLAWCCPSLAHEISFGQVRLEQTNNSVLATIDFPWVDVALIAPELGKTVNLATIKAKLLPRVQLLAGEQALPAILKSAKLEPKNLRFELEFLNAPNKLEVRALLAPENPLHKTFLDVVENNTVLEQRIFDSNTSKHSISFSQEQPIWQVLYTFFLEGIWHILIGIDHILFVISLLLAGGTVRQVVKVISAFTVAHSITLSLAALGVVVLPGGVVEPIIAASIVVVAGQSLLPQKRDWRVLFAFGFGLIHGFGFAGALSELELPSTSLVWALGSFNFGVEFGQVCIVLLVLPALTWIKRQSRIFGLVIPVGTVVVMAVGTFWCIERIWTNLPAALLVLTR
jgi:hydrogenase/urease accessory protein HupE